MTIHARGYRPYRGGFENKLAIFAIAREGFRIAFKRRSFKQIGMLYLAVFSICLFFLYLVMGTDVGNFLRQFERMLEGQRPELSDLSLAVLDQTLRAFYLIVSFLTALLAIFVGAGLVAEDLATGALPLYLVRPLRPWEYVLGKALVLPGIFFVAYLVPGLLFYLVVGLWQKPGETLPFLTGHLEVVGAIVVTYVVAAASYTGLMLFFSSRTSRQPTVSVMAGVAIFGGVFLSMLPRSVDLGGKAASLLLYLHLPRNTLTPFLWRVRAYEKEVQWDRLASTGGVVAFALLLLAVGFFAAWRRARSVEVVA